MTKAVQGRQRQTRASITALIIGLGLSGCSEMSAGGLSGAAMSLLSNDEAATSAEAEPISASSDAVLDSEMEDGTTSPLIEGLLNRRSVLGPGPLRDVAISVMAANTRAAEADLRAATLRAEAKSLNWLPSLGPSVSLTSLGSVVASLVINQALIDNGVRRAERDFAKHDVEVAAVALAEDSNERVLQALELYLRAEAAQARADVNAEAMERMSHFAYIMRERVNAGISDRADLQVVTQKQNQMASDMAADFETAQSARNELQAMAATPLSEVRGLSEIDTPSLTAEPLTVMKAMAESDRAVAEARAARAGFLPGLSIGGSVGTSGDNLGLNVGAPNGLSFGMGASMRAIEAEEQAAAARVGAEREAAERDLASLEGRLVSLRRQEAEARRLAEQAAANYDLFAEQQRAGQRGVTEVVGVFETKVRAERTAVEMRFNIAMAELRIAARLGTLVDGERM
ncbi:Outer membrane efflux protein [Flavimaricola marinus]|uniref:Outer membrane efflux protein n=1 Tax=Flavimaricola marinus TaxID=1819565 RepID=A0A238LJ32_9RHOB|nr:Outer membrane efflux protein [Flavimaricola marinus]